MKLKLGHRAKMCSFCCHGWARIRPHTGLRDKSLAPISRGKKAHTIVYVEATACNGTMYTEPFTCMEKSTKACIAADPCRCMRICLGVHWLLKVGYNGGDVYHVQLYQRP